MVADRPCLTQIWHWLEDVPDPEIPVISLTDLGIIRDVAWEGEALRVTVTPTYCGCPASTVIDLSILTALEAQGVKNVRLEHCLSPPWSSQWLRPEAREKLRAYGIAPPVEGTAPHIARKGDLVRRLLGEKRPVCCPRCGAEDTMQVSRRGSTPCKSSWRCNVCLEPFEYFKCI